MADNDFSVYLVSTYGELMGAAAKIAAEIANSTTELGVLRAEERREKAAIYASLDGGSTTAKDREAQISALSYTVEILPLEGYLAACVIEYHFILLNLSTRFNANVPDPPAISTQRF